MRGNRGFTLTLLINDKSKSADRVRRPGWRTVEGISFRNNYQANRYVELRSLERSGRISDLRHNAPYQLLVNKQLIDTYRATFSYKQDGQLVLVEMNPPTDVYRLKKRLVKALLGIDILEAY